MISSFQCLLFFATAALSITYPFQVSQCSLEAEPTTISPFPIAVSQSGDKGSNSTTFEGIVTTTAFRTLTVTSTETTGSIAETSPTPSPPKVHIIDVGARGDGAFDTSYVTAPVGDIVRFNLLSENITIVESTLQSPCQPNGLFYVNIDNSTLQDKDVSIYYPIVDLRPRWFYSKQPTSQEQCNTDIVFSINPSDKLGVFLRNVQVWADRPINPGIYSNNTVRTWHRDRIAQLY
ncbi:hypothetical protein F5Y16DRAFT_393262 [Xylariaceae sp. FL0255]|nr:hypothetical protein F5Y16DRAFT_393262 [Xylariaceae sp. FL0255]